MEIIKAVRHCPNQAYSYLFDTNVWLYIYGPVAGTGIRKQRIYSGLLSSIIDRNGTIFITSLILSEYINRVLRIGFRQWQDENHSKDSDFKHNYRKTRHYRDVLDDAIAQIKEILNIAQRRPDDFNAIDIYSVLDAMGHDSDYNDSYLIKCCENGGMKLVSDDGDMTRIDSNITLIKA